MNEVVIYILTKTTIVRCTADLVAVGIVAYGIVRGNQNALIMAAVLALLSGMFTKWIEYRKDIETMKMQEVLNENAPTVPDTKVDGLAGPETRITLIKAITAAGDEKVM